MKAIVILSLLPILSGALAFFRATWDRAFNAGLAFIVTGLLCSLVAVPVVGLSGGFMPDYSQGSRDGYVTKVSRSGVFIKTWEAQIQIGTGAMAALQAPFEFSVVDEGLVERLRNHAESGERVRITYRQYLFPNFHEGSSSYIATGATVLK